MNNHIHVLPFFDRAGRFVDFFFVLSGFVIFANYAERLIGGFGFWRFMLLRFGRLYPLHIFVLSVFIGFEALQVFIPQLGAMAVNPPFSQPGESVGFIVASLFLVQAMGFFDDNIIAFNGPSWSISTEFYAYALFAVLLIGLKKHIKLGLVLTLLLSGGFLYASGAYLGTTFKFGFLRCLFSFSAGALLWYGFLASKDRIVELFDKEWIWHLIEILLVLGLFCFMSYSGQGGYKMLATPLFVAIIWIFSFERGICSRILKYKFFVLLGTLSYSIYMLHAFIAGKALSVARYIAKNLHWDVTTISENGEHLLGKTIWQGDLITLGYLTLVVACSLITYKLIETPGRQYIRALVNKSQ